MHVAVVPSRQRSGEYSSVLVRQSYREGGKVKHRTLANLSKLPTAAVDAVRAVLRGEQVGLLAESFEILRALPHGAVLAILGELHQLGLDKLIAARPRRERGLLQRPAPPLPARHRRPRFWHRRQCARAVPMD